MGVKRKHKTALGLSGFKNLTGLLWLSVLASICLACRTERAKSDIEIIFTQDTINVGYTYWWPGSGPFIGSCGDELSLVFSGILTQLKEPTDDPGPLYVSQKGVIEIDKVFKMKELGKKTYADQKFFSTDCFYKSGLKVGDTVLVICYDYEDDYSIPGGKSILKITSFEDPLVQSVRKYIDNDQDPVKLKKDIGLWATQGLGRALEKIIACGEEMDSIQ